MNGILKMFESSTSSSAFKPKLPRLYRDAAMSSSGLMPPCAH